MPSLFSGLDTISNSSGGSLSSQDQEKLNKLKIDGDGTKFLNDKLQYVEVNSGNADIDDSIPASDKVYSSQKVEDEFAKKSDIDVDFKTWIPNVEHIHGDFYLKDNCLYRCTVSNSDSVWDDDKYILLIGYNMHESNKNNPHETKINNLKDINLNSLLDKQILQYNAETQSWENSTIEVTQDGKIKLTETGTIDYIINLINNSLEIKDGKLSVKTIDGLNVSIDELNRIKGLDSNLMDKIKGLTSFMNFKGTVNSDEDLNSVTGAVSGDTYIVKNSASHSNKAMTFIYNGTSFEAIAETTVEVRNFTTNPIDLVNEVTGKLDISHIDDSNLVKKTDLNNYMNKNNYDSNGNGIVDKAETLNGLNKSIDELNKMLTSNMVIGGDNVKITKNSDGSIKISSTGEDTSHNILDSNNTVMNSEDNLKFSSDFTLTDNATNKSTDIKISDTAKSSIAETVKKSVANGIGNMFLSTETYKGSEEGVVKVADKSKGLYISEDDINVTPSYYGLALNEAVPKMIPFPVGTATERIQSYNIAILTKNVEQSIDFIRPIPDLNCMIQLWEKEEGNQEIEKVFEDYKNPIVSNHSDNIECDEENGLKMKEDFNINGIENSDGLFEYDISIFLDVNEILSVN